MNDRSSPVIVWFREDLRLADNPALHAARQTGQPLICIYIFDDESHALRAPGGATKWWLHGALKTLGESLRKHGGALHILRGATQSLIEELIVAGHASAIFWNRRYDEAGRTIDTAIKSTLKERGIAAESFNANLLHEPWTIARKTNAPFKVFTPFWRALRAKGEPDAPLAAPRTFSFHDLPKSIEPVALADLHLEPHKPDWAGGLREAWTPGEAGAHAALKHFLKSGLPNYAEARDRPDKPATSRLSSFLHFGHISPRQVWHAAQAAMMSGTSKASSTDLDKFFSELGWREFSYHLLFHHPDLATTNFQNRFDALTWRHDAKASRAWQRGLTGYPIVDAGMRELWTTGWMHNRVRMVTASFLIKHLLIDWREGERWFWDMLVDADAANNAVSWQWVAGSGADAAPYFRIFNPVLQGERFDPDGAYVRRFIPELARLPAALIHKPWKATQDQLAAAGVRLGQTYPQPIVEHDFARKRALAAFETTR
ncbi:MAG: deoxyribodipyrimidine photo-lyase [Methylovirgula sp.]|uniref:cryptochrome/photolyase family protein n=1 Tax=Methylovirgula sp. TaxID=1978224 RepID=UPI0030762D49